MALLFPGKTRCGICHEIIEDDDNVVGFRAFLRQSHPLWKYSDGVFHQECFNRSPDREAVERLYKKYHEIWESRPRHLKKIEDMKAWHDAAFANFDKEEYGDRK